VRIISARMETGVGVSYRPSSGVPVARAQEGRRGSSAHLGAAAVQVEMAVQHAAVAACGSVRWSSHDARRRRRLQEGDKESHRKACKHASLDCTSQATEWCPALARLERCWPAFRALDGGTTFRRQAHVAAHA
jgi:hypothetical protein